MSLVPSPAQPTSATTQVVQALLQRLPLMTSLAAMVLAYSALKEKDATMEQRLVVLEKHDELWRQDHDLIVEMRTDVRSIKTTLDRLVPARFGSNGSPVVTPGSLRSE